MEDENDDDQDEPPRQRTAKRQQVQQQPASSLPPRSTTSSTSSLDGEQIRTSAANQRKAIEELRERHAGEDADEDDPYLIGADGKKIRRPLGTKRDIRELTELSRKAGDFSFADNLEPDAEGYKAVTWTQLRHNIGFEKVATKFKLHGTVSIRDQANWDKIKRIGVRDKDGFEAFLYFYDNNPEQWQWDDLVVGTTLAVKDPRYHRFMDGSEGMRVDSCSIVCEVKPKRLSDEERLTLGKMHKENGNKKFVGLLYEDAIDKYDEAIRCLTGTFHDLPHLEQEAKELAAACHLNIAACFATEKKWGAVENPCRRALALNATPFQNAKANFRMGQAQRELGNLVNATAALERALELQPGEPRVLEELELVRRERFELSEAQKEMFRTKAENSKRRDQQQQQQIGATASPTGTGSVDNVTPLSPTALAAAGNLYFEKQYRFGYQRSVLAALSGTRPLEQEFDSVENIRDLGAPSSSSSTAAAALPSVIKKHLLFRSASLVNLSRGDLNFLTERLGVKTVIDLRELDEVSDRIAQRKAWVVAENKKRARIRLEMRKAEIEVRARRDRQEKITSSSGKDEDGSGSESEYEPDENGDKRKKQPTVEEEIRRQRNRVFRRRMRKLEKRSTFSITHAIGLGDRDADSLSSDKQDAILAAAESSLVSSLSVPIEEYDEMLQRQDATLRPVEYIDLEAHFHRVSVKCKQGRITSYEAKDYDEFLPRAKKEADITSAITIPTREQWMRHEPCCLHIDFSSNTIFSLCSYWVWVVVLLLGLMFQVQWAAWVIVQMTAARVGAVSYYRSMLLNQQQEIREVFELLADESSFPVLICCEMGKDRTGVLVALILMACGASKEAIVQDYARTKSSPAMLEKCAKIGLTSEEWTKALPKTMEMLVSSIEAEGGITSYLKGIGVTDEMLEKVRLNLCERV